MYWKSVEELEKGSRRSGEFPGGLPGSSLPLRESDHTRRDFLSVMGFTVAAASLASCRAPVQHALPMMTGSDQIVPGVSSFYATTCGGCPSSCSLLVKQRDGRPIKVEGNDRSVLFGGGTCATGQATVLSLYDNERLHGPVWKGKPVSWREIDERITAGLEESQTAGHGVVLVSGTITSPSSLQIIGDLGKRYRNFRHVIYDPVSLSALRAANSESFGQAAIPHYAFDKARVIVALAADFLGTWLSPVEFARQYAIARRPGGEPQVHVHFEPGFSVTGSNADIRIAVAPSDLSAVGVALLRRIARKSGERDVPDAPEPAVDAKKLDAVAGELWKHRGESLVVCGAQDKALQVVVNAINFLLGNTGKTLDLARPSLQRNGDDAAMAELVEQMNSGDIHTLILHGTNPVYDYADRFRFASGLRKVALSISLSSRRDETGALVHVICPKHHFLESWGDAEPVRSHVSLAQPLIAPLYDTRSAEESWLRWMGDNSTHYTYLREYWRKNVFPRQKEVDDFDAFWDRSLQDGVIVLPSNSDASEPSFHGDWKAAIRSIADQRKQERSAKRDDRYEVHLYENVALRDGSHANNPWLQELPDPITKVTWGNFAAVAPQLGKKLGIENGDVISIKAETGHVQLPVFIQPGQHERTISIALGYGRTQAGKVAQNVGVNAYPLAALSDGFRRYAASNVVLEKTGRREDIASTQSSFSMEGRPIVLETTLEEMRREVETAEELPNLWKERLQGEHSWGMAIDMNSCTGCSACVIACQAENNVPVVGKDQVQRIRIMHWIRIDHYYSGSEDNPKSLHQPMMCQHCEHAPCATVCPVQATSTSSEGINQQAYNRCIGTRYCANNCPYKVRRFNWYNYTDNSKFDFNMASPVGRMVLNPDVVVRSRGVMEKCNLCVQRIQLAKNSALQGRRELADGDIQTACQQSCPTQAIVFGDLKDPGSRVAKLHRERRSYQVLEELGTRPNVGYLKRIRSNTDI